MSAIPAPQVPGDALFALMAKYKADDHPQKADLGVGAYRTNAGQPWVLPVVRKVDELLSKDPQVNHEYLPIGGNPDFDKASARLVLGADADLSKVTTVQTLSGTGANHMGARLLRNFSPWGLGSKTIWVSNPTWANHNSIFGYVGLEVKQYRYWDAKKRGLDFEGMKADLESAKEGDIVLLHACAHNPTGVDPTRGQWQDLAQVVRRKKLFAFFDSAYQGFATGSLDNDAWPVRYFLTLRIDLLICQSFAKNMGLYGERTGALHVILHDATPETMAAVRSQLEAQTRAELSNPPAYGARIATKILTTPDLFDEWKANVETMAQRIKDMRKLLRGELERLQTPGTWDHITSQIGMFSFTGLTKPQTERLVSEFHVYLASNGRISMAGVNEKNAAYIASSINRVVRESSKL